MPIQSLPEPRPNPQCVDHRHRLRHRGERRALVERQDRPGRTMRPRCRPPTDPTQLTPGEARGAVGWRRQLLLTPARTGSETNAAAQEALTEGLWASRQRGLRGVVVSVRVSKPATSSSCAFMACADASIWAAAFPTTSNAERLFCTDFQWIFSGLDQAGAAPSSLCGTESRFRSAHASVAAIAAASSRR